MTLALFYKPSYDRLKDRISQLSPELEVALYGDDGSIEFQGNTVSLEQIKPEYFWIHGELYGKKTLLNDYFKIMLKSDSIRWLHTVNTGLDNLSYPELLKKGVVVTNNHSQAISIAEFIFGQVLAYYQNVHLLKLRQSQSEWKGKKFREVFNTRWTIVGFGHIGEEIAKRAKAFGANVTAVRRKEGNKGLADNVIKLDQINSVLPNTDILVLACDSNTETRGCIGPEQFKLMNPELTLVNVARGDLVDEDSLLKALDNNYLGYAILDVVNNEPPMKESWLWQHPKVSLTPHTSNAGSAMRQRGDDLFLSNLDSSLRGLPLKNTVGA